MKAKDKRYINREISWLDFNQRVLHECYYEDYNVFDRLKFSAIFSSNLDEFFMVRVSGLEEKKEAGYTGKDDSGMSTKEQLSEIRERALYLCELQTDITSSLITNELKDVGISISSASELSETENFYIREYFMNTVLPVLTPMAIDSARPFPLVLNRSLNLIAAMEDGNYAIIQVPEVLGRFVKTSDTGERLILLEDLISLNAHELFDQTTIRDISVFRVTRNADIEIKNEEADDLLEFMEKSIFQRRWGHVIRLEISAGTPEYISDFLKEQFGIKEKAVYRIRGILDYTCLFQLGGMAKNYVKENMHLPKSISYDGDIFELIKKEDVFLHLPFDSFDIVTEFVQRAADDPNVLAIKQVLYRVSGDSPIIDALSRAAINGKQVTVLVELFARFDEENNIQWAKQMEQNGCHVIFGKPGIKTHAKILLVVRREPEGIRRYLHLGTGNYNDKTAKLYTDIGILTSSEALGEDASIFFNSLSGYTNASKMKHLVAAPEKLKPEIIKMINDETYWASTGRPAKIYAKMNALVDIDVIEALYQASEAGVEIKLLVRGICCLRAGVKGLSENIEVYSVIGEFLEHSRIYYFLNNKEDKLYISSADWMPRNLIRRVELLSPVQDERIKDKILEILMCYFNTRSKTRKMLPCSRYYSLIPEDINEIPAQERLTLQ